MYQIIWSEPAQKDYWQNIDFLIENWYNEQVQNFITAVDKCIKTIVKNPKTFALTEYKNVRSVLVVKQITLFYRIKDENTIELIRFWNNFQDPQKLKV